MDNDERYILISEKILRLVRDELYIDLKFLSVALSALVYKPDERLVTFATDGEYLMYSPDKVINIFEDNPLYLNRTYLHSVMHCLFSHLWLRGERDEYLWQIACDIAVEYTIDHIQGKSVHRILSLIRRQLYDMFEADGIVISAATAYRYLSGCDSTRREVLCREFFADDHTLWPKEKNLSNQQNIIQNRWKDISKQTTRDKKRSTDPDDEDAADILSYQVKAGTGHRDYRTFLKEFMVLHEEMHIDPDEFDMGYYMYGLSMYGDMPLIEPIETKEIKKIQDFVIVVDTSYSTSGELVKSFLKETFKILTDSDNFFKKSRVHLIQADDRVRDDIVLESELQIERVADEFEIVGGGNTDFRPVFEDIDKLIDDGEFEYLCGVLYFTDGRGIYPTKKPDYKTAFIYLDDYDESAVPVWAIREKINSDEL